MITVIGWRQYSLWIKHFKDIKTVKEFIKVNPGYMIVAVEGKIVYESLGVSHEHNNNKDFGGVF